MKKLITLIVCSLTLIPFISFVSSTTISQLVEINGTLYMNITYDDGSSELFQVVYVNGTAYLNITYDDGSNKLEELRKYIQEHEIQWSEKGATIGDFIDYLKTAINWLMGKEGTPEESKQIASILSSYFASHQEVLELEEKLFLVNLRLRSLEKALEEIDEKAYCRGKIDTMLEYNLSWVKCKNETYFRINPENFQGNEILKIEPLPLILPANVTNATFPNITIIDFKISDLMPGKMGEANVTLKNFGNATGSAEVSIRIPPAWVLEPESMNVSVEPNQTVTLTFRIKIPEEEKGKFSITGFAILEGKLINQTTNVSITPQIKSLSLTGFFVKLEDVRDYLINCFIWFKNMIENIGLASFSFSKVFTFLL